MQSRSFTAVLTFEQDGYSAYCPEVQVASQGDTIDEAVANLKEAVELFLECANQQEIDERMQRRALTTHFEVAVG